RALDVWPPLAAQYVGALAGLAAAGWLLRRWLADRRAGWGVALVAVQVATLAPLATYLPVRDARWLYPAPPSIAWLQGHVASARVVIADQVGMLYGLRQAHGYDGLSPRRITELAGPIGSGGAQAAGYFQNTLALHGSEPLPPISVLLAPTRELLGVRFIVLPPGASVAEPRLQTVYDGADARVVEDPAALPRAFVAPRARCAGDPEAVTLLRARSLTTTDAVLLADCTSPAAVEPRVPTAPEARIVIDDPARVVIAAAAHAPAGLRLRDTWFPWVRAPRRRRRPGPARRSRVSRRRAAGRASRDRIRVHTAPATRRRGHHDCGAGGRRRVAPTVASRCRRHRDRRTRARADGRPRGASGAALRAGRDALIRRRRRGRHRRRHPALWPRRSVGCIRRLALRRTRGVPRSRRRLETAARPLPRAAGRR